MGHSGRRVKKRDEYAPIAIAEAAHEYLASIKHLRPKTQEEYAYKLDVFSAWCVTHTLVYDKKTRRQDIAALEGEDRSPITLDQVDNRVVFAYLEHLKATHTPLKPGMTELASVTLAGHVRVIKSFLNWCLTDQQYSRHVQATDVGRIKKPKIIETIFETFTSDQIDALFKACEKEESEHLTVRDRAILALLLDTGLRANELVTLTIGNVCLDTKDAYIRVLGKGPKWGEVGLGEQSRRLLAKYIRTFREPTIEYEVKQQRLNISERQRVQVVKQTIQHARLFVNRSGKALTVSGLQQTIKRLGEWAGIEGVRCSPHTFRHTFSVNFIRQGGDVYRLSKLLRHTSVKVTEAYLKSLQQSEARKGAKSVLDNL